MSADGPTMGPSCTVLPVAGDAAVASCKPGTSSRGFWTASETADPVDDGWVGNSCLLGSELILGETLLCTLGVLLMGCGAAACADSAADAMSATLRWLTTSVTIVFLSVQ